MTKVPLKNHEMTHESVATFDPGGASPLGASILDLITELGCSQVDFATCTGLTKKQVNLLING